MELEHLPQSSGIYLVKNRINNKIYVGQSIDIKRRITQHLKQTIAVGILHNAISRYGAENFEISILEECSPDQLDTQEEYWIATLNATDRNIGYNICSKGGSRKGTTVSEESRARMRLAMQKLARTDSWRKKVSESMKLKYSDPIFIKKHSDGQKKRFQSKNQRVKHSEIMKSRCENPDFVKTMEKVWAKKCKEICAINLVTGDIKTYPSITNAAKELNTCQSNISRAVNGNKEFQGYVWSISKKEIEA